MAFRIIFLLVCLVTFIHGCSNLVSQKFGASRLQVVSMNEVRDSGIGNTDFIELSDAQITGDYIFAPGKAEIDRAVVLYPLVDRQQMDSLRQGGKVFVNLVAWEPRMPGSESDTVSIGSLQLVYRGMIQNPGHRFEKVRDLDSTRYQVADEVIYLAMNKEPLAWHWNLVIMAIAFSLFIFLGSRLRK